ncbi:hypothetical protein EVAR_57396_1 [Eumeta japonica]|uniref:Uncharacterized protein n=1 Tax=Eumeta variegata TaxID=151549 RepID=A0A4C1YB10_EUMVA|nr:hypothetical protein EVAR_57396_1 [Eumeta japonica]
MAAQRLRTSPSKQKKGRNYSGAECRRSSRGTKLHVPIGHGVEQRLGSFQVLTGDSGYLYAYKFNYTRRMRVCRRG